jgi:hypothetical protein
MMTEDTDLDALFAKAASAPATLSDALMARILADADAMQPVAAHPALDAAPPMGWFQTLADWFGGGMSLAGMSMAALTGLYLGVAQPLPVATLTELVTGSVALDSLELLPSTGTLWTQE